VNTYGEVVRFLTIWGPPPAWLAVGLEFRWMPGRLFGHRDGRYVFTACPIDPAELREPQPRAAANDPVMLKVVDP
jgi:hypothetical protein